jgi:hypothetical protein
MQPTVVAYNETGRVPLPDAATLATICHGATLISTVDRVAFKAALGRDPVAVITNSLDASLLQEVRDRLDLGSGGRGSSRIIVLVEKVITDYSKTMGGKDQDLADHFIAHRPGSTEGGSNWTITDLRATIQKIIRKDVFGIVKYLRTGARTRKFDVTSSRDREILTPQLGNFVLDQGLTQHVASTVRKICEEMLMNAIYDAPRAAGRVVPQDRQARANMELAPGDQAVMEIGFDGEIVAISIRDPFGLFERDVFFSHARKVLLRGNSEEILDKKEEGAGIGMMTLYFNSHGLVCNVAQGKATEVIAMIDTKMKSRDFDKVPRSIHYFKAPTTGVSAT